MFKYVQRSILPVLQIAVLLAGTYLSGPTFAADYPTKPIKLIVSFAPVAERMSLRELLANIFLKISGNQSLWKIKRVAAATLEPVLWQPRNQMATPSW